MEKEACAVPPPTAFVREHNLRCLELKNTYLLLLIGTEADRRHWQGARREYVWDGTPQAHVFIRRQQCHLRWGKRLIALQEEDKRESGHHEGE